MLKGPIILLVVLGTVLLLVVAERRGGVAAAVAARLGRAADAGGRAAVARSRSAIASGGAFFAIAVGNSLLGKVATGQQSHGAPPGLLSRRVSADLLAGLAVRRAGGAFVWARRREPAVRFCLCWIAPTWIVFELVATKLPHYVLPTYPAIACLTAAALLAPTTRAAGRRAVYAMRAYAGFGCSSASCSPRYCRSPPGCWKRASIGSAS